ncbi:hypothetical protein [Kribbella sp. NPDC004536]|uniref:hypothetical protein n=1 Tax=Kribbella sp. NPDC004536 TaxID=3364106 RepID=UPI0036BE63CE
MEETDVELRRSGFADWAYDYAFDHLITWPLAVVAFVGNWLTNMLVFRGGWTLHVRANGNYRRIRYPDKAAAVADIERQRALLAEVLPAEPDRPVRLPTRGGSLRRPW